MSAIFGERLVFGQNAGDDVELRVWGDEFYARYETLDGFTVVYDLDVGAYCYARLADGAFVSSGAPVWKPPFRDLRRHLREDGTVRNRKFRERFASLRGTQALRSANVARTLGRNSGLLDGRRVSRGEVRGLTILVEFDDLQSEVRAEQVSAMLNDLDYSANGNFCSVRRYYQLMSSSALDYTNRVVGPVRLSRKRSYYINKLLLDEALQLAIDDYGVDLNEFDSRGEGVVDALSVMYAGRTQYSGDLWPHNSARALTHGGVSTYFYTIQSLGRRTVDLSIGTFSHESGHMLCRFPDIYDYGERDGDFEESSGLGYYCLMSAGNHLNYGRTPSPICAYLRDLAEWCPNQVDIGVPGEYEAAHGDYGTLLRHDTDQPHEYFLLENRSRIDLDTHLPDAGLAVYHCDTRGSNEYQDGTPDQHYQCALLQADGSLDLEHNVNMGDTGDLFEAVQGEALSDSTTPPARAWDGTDCGLLLADIDGAGQVIRFRAGEVGMPDRVTLSVRPDLVIPDHDPDGITSRLSVAAAGRVASIRIGVDISHTYRGDLQVDLVSPAGTSLRLHERSGGTLDDLHLDLSSETDTALAKLVGEPAAGDWQLQVRDLLQDDQGRLDYWTLEIDLAPAPTGVRKEIQADLDIPDADPTGVASIAEITENGALTGIRVGVEIRHSYRGDLQLELTAASGGTLVLSAASWDSGQDLRAVFDPASVPALEGLIGSEIQGDWTLRVKDLARRDRGTLDRWWLELER